MPCVTMPPATKIYYLFMGKKLLLVVFVLVTQMTFAAGTVIVQGLITPRDNEGMYVCNLHG